MFWNPAATVVGPGLAAGVEVLQTPDVVSLSGVVGGVAWGIGSRFGVGVLGGRVSVKDLVRTTTSPTSEFGEIPVYAQLAGVAAAARFGVVTVGGVVRGHDARFDTLDDSRVTADVGIRLTPHRRLAVAAASRFAPPVFGGDNTTDYNAALEYGVRTATVWGSEAVVVGRYGLNYRPDVGVEHFLGVGVDLAARLRVDLGWNREHGLGTTAWRSAVGLALRAGRYVIAIARGSGLSGLGASFRLSLNAGLLP